MSKFRSRTTVPGLRTAQTCSYRSSPRNQRAPALGWCSAGRLPKPMAAHSPWKTERTDEVARRGCGCRSDTNFNSAVSFGVMPSFLRELRLAARKLARSPGFAAVAVITLSLGIGATSAVFSLIQGVLLTPPPYRDPDRLVLISPARADGGPYLRDWTAGAYLDIQKEAKSFEALASYD